MFVTDFNSAEVHGVFNDVVVIVYLQSFSIHRLVEGPGVRRVFFGQHFLQDITAVLQLLAQAASPFIPWRLLLLKAARTFMPNPVF